MLMTGRAAQVCAAAVVALVVCGALAVSAAGHVTRIQIAANPPKYVGHCPVTIHFRGALTVDGPATVTYGVQRSDGGHGPGGQLTFKGPGSQNVSDEWQLGESLKGWVTFGSGNVHSNRAAFQVTCR